MKYFYGTLLLLALCIPLISQSGMRCSHYKMEPGHSFWQEKSLADTRSDSLDIIHYHLELDITDFTDHILTGTATLSVAALVDEVGTLYLDLSDEFEVSQVMVNGLEADFLRTGDLLTINLGTLMMIDDVAQVQITYAGLPDNPGSSFGGFYFTDSYAYNLGIGIGIYPPSVGRAWYPCYDSFVERASYSFAIKTPSDKKAFCNGLLQYEEDMGTYKIWHWELSQTIPAYLSSMAVSAYATVSYSYAVPWGFIPVQLAALAGDTTAVKNSFVHLNDAITGYEQAFGPYPFDRVGFVMVPFNGGAMEHATNIAYPRTAAIAGTAYEELMAHEFAHSWWGDHITCDAPDQMWINEGWASFCQEYFHEFTYGKENYKDAIRDLHLNVLLYTHINDGGYYPVAGIPYDLTYSSHVYEKGADVIHTLRGYLGDEVFFHCSREIQNIFSYRHLNTDSLEAAYSACSEKELSYYFDYWIRKPGFPHFSIDSMVVHTSSAPYEVSVFIRQRLVGTDEYYENVPLDITLLGFELATHTTTAMVSGPCTELRLQSYNYPLLATLDKDEKIGDATLDKYYIINSPTIIDVPESKCRLDVLSLSDHTFIRVQHHLVMPDRELASNVSNLQLSPNRYWSIEVLSGDNLSPEISGEFIFNGTSSTNGGYLDNDLGIGNENDLKMMYRPGPGFPWIFVPNSTIDTQGSAIDKRGKIIIPQIVAGEYALGRGNIGYIDPLVTYFPEQCNEVTVVSGIDSPAGLVSFQLYPNPVEESFSIVGLKEIYTLKLYDFNGKLVQQWWGEKGEYRISTSLFKGLYLAEIQLISGDSFYKRIYKK